MPVAVKVLTQTISDGDFQGQGGSSADADSIQHE
jgi:hypothetical protein